MSMISSMLLGRKQPPPPPQHQHQPGQKTKMTNGGGGEAVEPPLSIDIQEQPPSPLLTDGAAGGLSLAAMLGCLGGGLSSSPASMDWKETATAHVFMADVPGLRREDVKVEVGEEKLLRISGQRAPRAADDKGDRWHRVERAAGERFSRTVRLPPNASTDGAGVHASLDNGVLTVTIPKDDGRKAYGRIIPITN